MKEYMDKLKLKTSTRGLKMYSSNLVKVVESAGWKSLLCAVPFLLLGCGATGPIEFFPEAAHNHFEVVKPCKE